MNTGLRVGSRVIDLQVRFRRGSECGVGEGGTERLVRRLRSEGCLDEVVVVCIALEWEGGWYTTRWMTKSA